MTSPLRILLLEDNTCDAELIQDILEGDHFVCQLTRVQTRIEFLAGLKTAGIDLILADYTLPSFDGLSALRLALSARPELPFIFVSGTLGEEVAIEALKIGATDYVLKTRLSRLVPSVQRAVREAQERAERKKAEEALRRSEMYLAEAQRLSHTGSFGWDPVGGKMYWSDETYRIFGYEPTAKPTFELMIDRTHPDDRVHLHHVVDRAVIEGREFTAEHRLMMADGSVKYVRAVAHRSAGENPERLVFLGAITDITERKRAEDTVREQANLLSLTHDAIFVRDMNGIITYWNPAAEALYGWTAEQAKGKAAGELLKSIFPVPFGRIMAELLSSGRWEGELVRTKKDGTQVTVASRWSLQRDAQGTPSAALETNNDITERKRAEKELRASEERFRDYAEAASDWLWETDRDHRFTLFGRSAGSVFRRFIGARRWEVAEDRDEEPAKWRQHRATLDAHQPFRGLTFRLSRSDGHPVYVSVSGKPIFDVGGNFLGYRGVGSDVSAEVRADQAERALREAQSELAHVARVTTLGELSASIAHEVNQPVTAVAANAEAALLWLARRPPDLEEAQQALGRIVKDANRAGDVLERIRALVRKAASRSDSLEINEAILEVIALTRGELVRTGVSLQTQLADDLPLVRGDRVQLQQVILNLIVNAIEAMSAVGEGARELLISSGDAGPDGILVAVRDSGPGLAPANIEHVFEAFYTTKPDGLGMGLSICRSIIEAHGGRLSAAANMPAGAVFQFTVPAQSLR